MKDPAAVQALTFDCYGTLIDWDAGIRAYLRRLLDAKGAGTVDLDHFYHHWYHECELPAIAGPFMSYHEVLQTSVQRALRDFGLPPGPQVLHVFQSKIVDLPTATLLGLQTAWINRQHQELEPDRSRPDSIFPDLLPLLSSLKGA